MVNQAKVEEMEDEQILMLAESDKNKYEMPETNVENLAYESKMINIVIGKVHQIYTDVTSDDIARYVRQILAEDAYHRMKPTEVAKEVVAIITGSPTRKKRRPSSKAPASKNICDYISNAQNKETQCFFVLLYFYKQTKQTLEILSFMKLEQIFFVKEVLSFIMKKQDNFLKEVVSFLKKLLVS